ncbi:MAG: HAD family phosphatase [Parcubacteria group bacterium]
MMIRAIIWDLDGVLANSEPLWEQMTSTHLRERGVSLPENFDYLTSRYMKGRDVRQAELFVKQYFKIKDSLAKIHRERMDIILKLMRRHLRQIPYALQTIKKVYGKYALALVSSSPRIVVEVELKKLKMRKYFDYILAGDEVRIAKPNPSIFLWAAKKLKVKPSECIVIENSLAGVQAAKRAGMICVLLKTYYTLPIQRRLADVTIASLRELPRVVKKLAKSNS